MNPVPFPEMKRQLIAILRGLKPQEAEGIVSVLIELGMAAIEIPLNSPDPFRSIEIAVKLAPRGILVGAGTVLTTQDVERLHDQTPFGGLRREFLRVAVDFARARSSQTRPSPTRRTR